ncbi:MAG: tryptophan--tRNA ligase [Candidatus Omnitrophica bacterium]|nr:tryptophan--tRNA ligase [Candidatus Omnitrophota bacterium]MCM8793057.1 tryptophan--tRNA ligase [Candidatus Omnitrophota bacterium]
MKKRVLSGMRPTGKLHLGHLVGALANWVKLQKQYSCFFMLADWHALMSEYQNPQEIKEYVFDNLIDWLACGISPEESVIFLQSEIKEHLELNMILSVLTPLAWLERCPTYKEQLKELKEKELTTYGFLGYPVLQAADILLYRASFVPVGQDQLPHLELTRELVRRFHHLYKKNVFVEPQALLTEIPKLLGIDGRKMSKSYGNFIALSDAPEVVRKKTEAMFTDPQRIKKDIPGRPWLCNVYTYYKVFKPELAENVWHSCMRAELGCKDDKRRLGEIIVETLKPIQERRDKFRKDRRLLEEILFQGNIRAKKIAQETLQEVKVVLKI